MQPKIDTVKIEPGETGSKMARGRNGVFKPRHITFAATREIVRFELLSQRAGGTAPIWFEMSPEEAREFNRKLAAVLPEEGKETNGTEEAAELSKDN